MTVRARRPAPFQVRVTGYVVTARDGRVYLVDDWPARDPHLTAEAARALGRALGAAAAAAAKQQSHPDPDREDQP